MIDLLATAIAYLVNDADLMTHIQGRIAERHKFAMGNDASETLIGWPTPSAALTLAYDGGGVPDTDAGMERGRLDARCYGTSPEEAGQVYARLIRICRDFVRTTVSTDQGVALFYQIYPDSSARSDQDPDTHVDFVQVFLRASCAQDSV